MARLASLTLTLAAALAVLASPARAQLETGIGVSPDAGLFALDAPASTQPAATPLALALALAFDATTWAAVGVSTEATPGAMAELLARGYYRLEILQLTLLARGSGERLLDLRTRRTKDGRTLRALAEAAKLPYDQTLDRAEELAAVVDARLKDLESVPAVPKPTRAP
ncbi:MAG: hypothetical protein HYZ75_13345 [Elusimicrobia bacterium]|nr:hypothetical protein [Elusimicrobiota bacterium]